MHATTVETRRDQIAHSAPWIRRLRGGEVKLDVDLVRDLLLHIEEHADRPVSGLSDIVIEHRSPDEVSYHVVLAEEFGLISATIQEVPDGEDDTSDVVYSVHRLTMQGHEFLDTVRDGKHWRAIKGGAKDAGLFTLKAIIGFGTAYVDQRVRNLAGGAASL